MINLNTLACLPLFIAATACGGGGGSDPFQGTPVESLESSAEAEPNADKDNATPLSPAGAGHGSITSGGADIDYWSFEAVFGRVYSVDVFAIRRDCATWRDECTIPDRLAVTLVDRDGLTALLTHDSSSFAGQTIDRGISLWMAPLTGTYYLAVSAESGGQGSYAIVVREVDEPFATEAAEPNDSPAEAQTIVPGLLRGTANGATVDPDHYALEILEPSIVRVEIVRLRNGRWQDDVLPLGSRILLVDAAETALVEPSAPAHAGDYGFEVLVDSPGTYYLQVLSGINLVDTSDGSYWLNYELVPVGSGTEGDPLAYGGIVSGEVDGGTDVLSFEGTAGDLVHIHLYGPDTHLGSIGVMGAELIDPTGTPLSVAGDTAGLGGVGTAHRILRALLPQSGAYTIELADVSVSGPVQWSVELELVAGSRWESEANGSPDTADPLDGAGRAAGRIESASTPPTLPDAFAIDVDKPGLIRLNVYGGDDLAGTAPDHGSHGSSLVPAVNVKRRAGDGELPLASSWIEADTCGFPRSTTATLPSLGLSFVATTAGTHYVLIGTFESAVNGDARYLLEIE